VIFWLKSRVVQIGLAIGAVLAAVAALRHDARKDGRREAITDAKERDHDRADEIRRDDDRGYRD
jgi:hypothetical protein